MILDANALSAWADGNPGCRDLFMQARLIVVPSIVLGEYRFGILQSRHCERYEQWLTRNLPTVQLAPIGPELAEPYARIRHHLKTRGTPIPSNDLWIAALASHRRLPILSNDAHFDLVPGIMRVAFGP